MAAFIVTLNQENDEKDLLIGGLQGSRLTEDPNVAITTADKHDFALKQASLSFTEMFEEKDKVIQNQVQVQEGIVNGLQACAR